MHGMPSSRHAPQIFQRYDYLRPWLYDEWRRSGKWRDLSCIIFIERTSVHNIIAYHSTESGALVTCDLSNAQVCGAMEDLYEASLSLSRSDFSSLAATCPDRTSRCRRIQFLKHTDCRLRRPVDVTTQEKYHCCHPASPGKMEGRELHGNVELGVAHHSSRP